VTEIRSFFSLAGYYRRFVQDFSIIAKLMTRLTEKGATFKWCDIVRLVFRLLRINW
jgi:hypothetical protein